MIHTATVNTNTTLTLTDTLLKDLFLQAGDKLYITKTENGGLLLTPFNPELNKLINIYEKFSQKRSAFTI